MVGGQKEGRIPLTPKDAWVAHPANCRFLGFARNDTQEKAGPSPSATLGVRMTSWELAARAVPSLRSGFRHAAPAQLTPRGRLNLPRSPPSRYDGDSH